jgi:hypothetical protein
VRELALKPQANRKILVGATIEVVSSVFCLVSAFTGAHVPQPLLWTYKLCTLVAIAFVYLGLHEERAKRKLIELSRGTLFPEAH